MDSKVIGEKIAKARKDKSMSQAQLAQHIFISPQAVGKWERGESMPDITTFDRLAEILGVDLNYFSENAPSAADKTANAGEAITPPAHSSEKVAGQQGRQVLVNLTAADLPESDFAGVVLHKGTFKASSLRGADFSNADLTSSSFDATDAREANFDGADLTGCNFSATDLTGASFGKSVLVGTILNMSGQGAKFVDAKLVDVKLIKTDLRKAIFENCTFTGVDFSYCDLRGTDFGSQTFDGVRFDKSALTDVSFQGATLRNVSFTVPFSLTNKAHLSLKTIRFDGARMDKLTYLALKGLRVVDLSNVTII
ncbi:pentapeptide repeat-containing protein [Dyadobacter sp. OTU695]|uniref:pentapeptide repeat-containing protein n=1 Tax=Dyadobacter sp. OTU695 TaxID=3043860 RepID=UPI00313CB2E6